MFGHAYAPENRGDIEERQGDYDAAKITNAIRLELSNISTPMPFRQQI